MLRYWILAGMAVGLVGGVSVAVIFINLSPTPAVERPVAWPAETELDPAVSANSNSKANAVVINATPDEISLINNAIGYMTSEVQSSIISISVSRDSSPPHFLGFEQGHCHADGQICVLAEHLTEESGRPLIWHEGAHAYLYKLGAPFLEEWVRIAGGWEVYDQNRYLEYQKFPYGGVLWWYGSVSPHEDLALLTEAVYRYAFFNDLILVEAVKKIDKQDRRYLNKLTKLLEGKFITEEMYKKVEPLFK